MDRNKIRKLIKEEIENIISESDRTYTQFNDTGRRSGGPIRHPFSNYPGERNPGLTTGVDRYNDLTDLYNISYKKKYDEEPFEKVVYNGAINILVCFVKNDSKFKDHFVTFGLKTARGFHRDHRFLDRGYPGSGRFYVSEDQAVNLIENPIETISEINQDYIYNFGVEPIMSLDTLKESNNRSDKLDFFKSKIREEKVPAGWSGILKEMKEKYPDTFGGRNPEVNPYAVIWNMYYKGYEPKKRSNDRLAEQDDEENPWTGWENLPPGWDEDSLESFAQNLTGQDDEEGFFSACMDEVEDKFDEPEAFCASLKDEYLGREDWRGED